MGPAVYLISCPDDSDTQWKYSDSLLSYSLHARNHRETKFLWSYRPESWFCYYYFFFLQTISLSLSFLICKRGNNTYLIGLWWRYNERTLWVCQSIYCNSVSSTWYILYKEISLLLKLQLAVCFYFLGNVSKSSCKWVYRKDRYVNRFN